MRDITLEELLEAGCHFGHQVNRRNPKAQEFIFEDRSNIDIIDLGKTRDGLLKAAEFAKSIAEKGGSLVVVGTKRQAKPIVEEEVERARKAGAKNIFYVTSRWVGGTLTNFPEVSKNIKRLQELNSFLTTGDQGQYTKREILLFQRERDKLKNLYEGITGLPAEPSALFIIDTHAERTAVHEAHKMGVSLVGIVDTNADPADVSYAIPANDDAVGSVKFIMAYIADAWIEGSKEGIKKQESRIKEEEKKAKKEEK